MIGAPATLAGRGAVALLAAAAYAMRYPAIRRDLDAANARLGLVSGPAAGRTSTPSP